MSTIQWKLNIDMDDKPNEIMNTPEKRDVELCQTLLARAMQIEGWLNKINAESKSIKITLQIV